jgi:hypothetical protein
MSAIPKLFVARLKNSFNRKQKTPANSMVLESVKNSQFTCTLLALLRKSLIINGAGEGNRTLVSISRFSPSRHLTDALHHTQGAKKSPKSQ